MANFSFNEDEKIHGNGTELNDNGEDNEAVNIVVSTTDDGITNMLSNLSISKLFEDFVDHIEWHGTDYHHNHDSMEI